MKKTIPPAKKTKSYKAYQRAVFWQVIFPMLIVALIFVGVSFATSTQGAESLGKWASISVVWLSLPMIVFLIVNLLLLAGLIYGIAKLLDITPTYTHKLTSYIYLVGEKIESFADKAAEPVIKLEGVSASLRSIFRKK
jgi:uncharacterized protein involved in cysteine biosynthesis